MLPTGSVVSEVGEIRPGRRTGSAQRLIHLSSATWLVLVSQWALWLLLCKSAELSGHDSIFERLVSLVVSSVAIVALFQAANLLMPNWWWARRSMNCLLCFVFLLLFAIHLSADHSLDAYFVGENFGELIFPETLGMVWENIGVVELMGLATLTLLVLGLSYWKRGFDEWPRPGRYRTSLAIACLAVIVCVATPLYRYNDLTYLARTAFDFAFVRYAPAEFVTTGEYPYVQRADAADGNDSIDKPLQSAPHVFLVMLESFNANFAEQRTVDGREFTPTFNALVKRGVYVERFYGNSIQTCRGQEATLLSILPSLWNKIFTDYEQLTLRSLPAILKDHGYRTLFFQAQKALDYDNTGPFLSRNGFDEAYGMEGPLITARDEPYLWGYGLQDDKMYEKLFRHLDANERKAPGAVTPYFTMVASISHHWPFSSVPREQRYLYPDPRDKQEVFANSIHLADRYLAEFFRQLQARAYLRNSIVVILGDHSFPAGEHGNYFNEKGFYEENFRTPLLVLWDGHLEPRRIARTPHSQLDVAPTILDLLNIKTEHHFQGRSIFQPADPQRAVCLIQPYNGTYLCVVKYPYKYVRAVRIPGEYLYDLEHDPHEANNLIAEHRATPLYEQFQHELARIHLNHHLIETDRIWPRERPGLAKSKPEPTSADNDPPLRR